MIKLKDLLNEAQLSKYQIFSPGTGGKDFGNMKFDPTKIPTGRLNVSSMVQYGGQCHNKPTGAFWTSSYKQKFKGSAWTDHKKKRFPTWHTSMGAVFEIKGSPKILKIRSHNDYMKVQKKAKLDASKLDLPKGSSHLEQATKILVFLRRFKTYEFSLKLNILRVLCLKVCFSLGSSPTTIHFQSLYLFKILITD